MIFRIITISVFLFLAACGPDDGEFPVYFYEKYWDASLAPYIEEISGMLHSEGIDSNKINDIRTFDILNFREFPESSHGGYYGVCVRYSDAKDVYIDKTFWQDSCPTCYGMWPQPHENRLMMLIHEIGHCAYDMPHSNNPESLMYPTFRHIRNAYDFENRWKVFIEELRYRQKVSSKNGSS